MFTEAKEGAENALWLHYNDVGEIPWSKIYTMTELGDKIPGSRALTVTLPS